MKTCSKCDKEKVISEFAKNPSSKSGLSNKCRECFNAQVRARYTKDDRRRHHLRYKFGLSLEQYEQMIEDCDARCPACKRQSTDLHIDHDHRCCSGKSSCGKCIRGLLCGPCNRALGLLQENEEAILGLLEYIRTKEHFGG